jgi:hypothetical protein
MFAIRANSGNALNRRKGDVKRAVLSALARYPQHSNRQIAALCSCSATVVNNIVNISNASRTTNYTQSVAFQEVAALRRLAAICGCAAEVKTELDARQILSNLASDIPNATDLDISLALQHMSKFYRTHATHQPKLTATTSIKPLNY